MKRYLSYQQLSVSSEGTAAAFDEQQAKQQRHFEIQRDILSFVVTIIFSW